MEGSKEGAAGKICGTRKELATTERAEETAKKAMVTSSAKKLFKRKNFDRRRATLAKQAKELKILCGCQVAMFCIQPDGNMDAWPPEQGTVDSVLEAFDLHKRRPQKPESDRGKGKVDGRRMPPDAVNGAEPIALSLGFGPDSCETRNCSNEEASGRLEGLALRDENYNGDLVDLDLRLGFGIGNRALGNKETCPPASLTGGVLRIGGN